MSTVPRWFLPTYAFILLLLLPWQSLWLDELMEVVATHSSTLSGVITGYALHSAGQSPLGAIEQWLSVHIFTFSNWSARLPAALASILALWGMCKLAVRAGVNKPFLAVALLATVPLQLRYATEARPYSQAFCIAVWLTYFALELPDNAKLLAPYLLTLCIGLYTQPFVVFVAVAHMCWLLTLHKKRAIHLAITIAIACLVYIPWYLAARSLWSQEVSAEDLHFHWQAKLPLVIFRELLATGYVGTALAIALAACAWRNQRPLSATRALMCWSTALPLVLVVIADAKFDYFFAIRQVITVLPALFILISFGLETIPLSRAIVTLFLALNLGYSARWFTKPRENWAQAADVIANNLKGDSCYTPIPAGTAAYYTFFRPELNTQQCTGNGPQTIVLALSPYLHNRAEAGQLITSLTTRGYTRTKKHNDPEIDIFVHSPLR